jgi:hypothetical protein
MGKNTKLLYYFLVLSLLPLFGCNDNSYDGIFVMGNLLDERVIIEGYYIPFDFPTRPMEKGELILEKKESLLLYQSSYDDRVEPSAFNALRVFLEIQGMDSVVFIFEDNTHLSYNSNNILDSKNPILGPIGDISGWAHKEVGKDSYQFTFRISEAHKAAAN